MTKAQTGELLYRFYQKRITSFLANLYKARITTEVEDIHQTRVDAKKIFALFALFKLADPQVFKIKEHQPLFKNLFSRSGKIREIQLIREVLETWEKEPGSSVFQEYLKDEERKAIRMFISAVGKFEEKKISTTNKTVKKLCKNINQKQLMLRLQEFILHHMGKIRELQQTTDDIQAIHEIRKQLKSISAIIQFINDFKQSIHYAGIIQVIKVCEETIGEWHDRVVFLEYLDRFLVQQEDSAIPYKSLYKEIARKVLDENEMLLTRFYPQIEMALEINQSIFSSPADPSGMADQ